jgi:hypothetical protein
MPGVVDDACGCVRTCRRRRPWRGCSAGCRGGGGSPASPSRGRRARRRVRRSRRWSMLAARSISASESRNGTRQHPRHGGADGRLARAHHADEHDRLPEPPVSTAHVPPKFGHAVLNGVILAKKPYIKRTKAAVRRGARRQSRSMRQDKTKRQAAMGRFLKLLAVLWCSGRRTCGLCLSGRPQPRPDRRERAGEPECGLGLRASLLACARHTGAAAEPLSAIDWLSDSIAAPARARSRRDRPVPAAIPRCRDAALGDPLPDGIGLLSAEAAGLPRTLWRGSTTDETRGADRGEPRDLLPSPRALLKRLLLAELDPPADADARGDC